MQKDHQNNEFDYCLQEVVMRKIPPPISEEHLLLRSQEIAGKNLAEIAYECGHELPLNLKHHKGFIGVLIEQRLGASASSKSEPDFPHLGIELKTIPLNDKHQPSESTFVHVISLSEIANQTWETSLTYKKLRKVLWVPLEAHPNIAMKDRRVGQPLLWSPNQEQEAILKQDWEELIELISLGKLTEISAKQGRFLQIRPKGANSKSLTWAIGESGDKIKTLPRGFYLRASFTAQILKKAYCLEG